MKYTFFILISAFFVLTSFVPISSQKIDPVQIKNDILKLREKCKDLDIHSSKEIFIVYYANCISNLSESTVKDLQKAIIQGAKHNGMRITFKDLKNYGDLMFVVPFEKLDDFKSGKLSREYGFMLEPNLTEDRILAALFSSISKEKPLVIVDGIVSDPNLFVDGKKYFASSLTILPPKAALKIYGESAIYGAVEFVNITFKNK